MQVIHFTPGSLDPNDSRHSGGAASLPLASGTEGFELSRLYVAPHGQILVAAQRHCQLLLVVNGCASARCPHSLLLETSAGMGLLLGNGEGCQLSTKSGVVVLAVGAPQIQADPCGLSSPDRVAG